MNWYEVRKHNAKRSARKARREATEAARKARIERAGGPITADEVRDATFRIEPPAHGYGHERFVWTLRGRDWVLGYSDGDQWQALAPFCSWGKILTRANWCRLRRGRGRHSPSDWQNSFRQRWRRK